jgi:hypothetical protein
MVFKYSCTYPEILEIWKVWVVVRVLDIEIERRVCSIIAGAIFVSNVSNRAIVDAGSLDAGFENRVDSLIHSFSLKGSSVGALLPTKTNINPVPAFEVFELIIRSGCDIASGRDAGIGGVDYRECRIRASEMVKLG